MFTSIFQETMATENWQKIQKLGNENTPVLFPIGVIEEHGPHLPLGSDIYWSYAMCRMIKAKLKSMGKETLIAPPYYWGVNHCTAAFSGTFSLKPETMSQVLFEIFENMKNFSFHDIICFNYHGDAAHTNAIVNAITKAYKELGLSVKLVIDAINLPLYGWNGDEDFLLIVNPEYPMEWFTADDVIEEEDGLLDIHAGAFETAVMNYFYPDLVDLDTAVKLKSSSLNGERLQQWLQGGEVCKNTVPLGYAGNPAGYMPISNYVEEMIALQVDDIVSKIIV